MPVYALTPYERVQRRLALYWGIEPLHSALEGDTDQILAQATQTLASQGLCGRGDLTVVVGAARRLGSGRADFVKLHTI